MAWLSRVNFTASDVLSYTDLNNLGNDIRAWGGNVNGGGYTLSNIAVSASSGTMATINGGTGASSTLTVQSTSGSGTSDAIIFKTASQSERMRIDTSGNVGIGTASPASRLNVRNTSLVADAGIVQLLSRTDGPYLGIGHQNWDGTHYAAIGGTVTDGSNNTLGALRFFTRQSSTDANLTERMRIDSSGNVKIGGTADRATTAGTAHLDIFNGTAPAGTLANGISIYSSSGEAYVMDAAGNATLFSPHDRETNEWIFDSTDTRTGKRLKINVERLLRFINDHFGLDCVHDLMEEA